MEKNKLNSQTAYENNAHSSTYASTTKNHGWSDAINRMIEQRYAFLGLQYEQEGFLFRGMSTGLSEALIENKFWHYHGDDRGNLFEKDLDVILLSQDFSDAFTVSKFWEKKEDACILTFKSRIFNEALAKKNAAMMATAEPGVVFKYPFLCHPLTLDDIDYLIVASNYLERFKNDKNFKKLESIINKLQASKKLIQVRASTECSDRSIMEKMIVEVLSDKGIKGARPVKSEEKPILKGI